MENKDNCKNCEFFYDANDYNHHSCDGSDIFCCYYPTLQVLSMDRPICNFYRRKADQTDTKDIDITPKIYDDLT